MAEAIEGRECFRWSSRRADSHLMQNITLVTQLLAGLADALGALLAVALVALTVVSIRAVLAVRSVNRSAFGQPATFADVEFDAAASQVAGGDAGVLLETARSLVKADGITVLDGAGHAGPTIGEPELSCLELEDVSEAIAAHRTLRTYVEPEVDEESVVAAASVEVGLAVVLAPVAESSGRFLVATRRSDRAFSLRELDLLCRLITVASADALDLTALDAPAAFEARPVVDAPPVLDRRRLANDLTAALAASVADVGVVAVAIDRFADLAAACGEEMAEQLSRDVAAVIGTGVRSGDVVYCYSDGEFGLLLPAASALETADIAERVRASVEAHSFGASGARMTLSIGTAVAGVADGVPSAVGTGAVLASAEQALAVAKRDSNCVAAGVGVTGH